MVGVLDGPETTHSQQFFAILSPTAVPLTAVSTVYQLGLQPTTPKLVDDTDQWATGWCQTNAPLAIGSVPVMSNAPPASCRAFVHYMNTLLAKAMLGTQRRPSYLCEGIPMQRRAGLCCNRNACHDSVLHLSDDYQTENRSL